MRQLFFLDKLKCIWPTMTVFLKSSKFKKIEMYDFDDRLLSFVPNNIYVI